MGHVPEITGETKFPETGDRASVGADQRLSSLGGNHGQGHSQVSSGLVDPHPSHHVHKNIG